MAVELEKLAQDLQRKGYQEGSTLLSSLAPILESAGVIPKRLYESRVDGELPEELLPFVVITKETDPASQYYHEIDALGLSPRARNPLIRRRVISIRTLYYTSDMDIRSIWGIGQVNLRKIRESLAQFRQRIINERKRLAITNDTPVIIG